MNIYTNAYNAYNNFSTDKLSQAPERTVTIKVDSGKNDAGTTRNTNGADAFGIKDTYEPSSQRPDTNYGGYDRTGRMINGYSNILKTNVEDLSVRMKNSGLQTEDLVYPDKVTKLSDEPKTQNALADFATSERQSLLSQSGMTDEELDDFISKVR